MVPFSAYHGYHLGIGLWTPSLVSKHNRHLPGFTGIISAAIPQRKRVGSHFAGESTESYHCLALLGLQASVCQPREQLAPGKGSPATLTAFCFFKYTKLSSFELFCLLLCFFFAWNSSCPICTPFTTIPNPYQILSPNLLSPLSPFPLKLPPVSCTEQNLGS